MITHGVDVVGAILTAAYAYVAVIITALLIRSLLRMKRRIDRMHRIMRQQTHSPEITRSGWFLIGKSFSASPSASEGPASPSASPSPSPEAEEDTND